jgi:large subunit ribosomal protein L10
MALNKAQKTKQIESIKEKVSKQKSVIFVDFAKVPSKDMFSLRKSLKESGCNLKVAKKTLVRIAFGQSGISFWNKMKASMPGQLALVFGIDDDIAPARIANMFAKTQENLKILGGIFENRYIDREKVLVLANLPTKKELLGRLVGSIYSPVSSFVRVLNKIAEKNNN